MIAGAPEPQAPGPAKAQAQYMYFAWNEDVASLYDKGFPRDRWVRVGGTQAYVKALLGLIRTASASSDAVVGYPKFAGEPSTGGFCKVYAADLPITEYFKRFGFRFCKGSSTVSPPSAGPKVLEPKLNDILSELSGAGSKRKRDDADSSGSPAKLSKQTDGAVGMDVDGDAGVSAARSGQDHGATTAHSSHAPQSSQAQVRPPCLSTFRTPRSTHF